MKLKEKELTVYAKTGTIEEIYAVSVVVEQKIKWRLEFKIRGEEGKAMLVTSLNSPRLFPRLDSMVDLVRVWCPKNSVIHLVINS